MKTRIVKITFNDGVIKFAPQYNAGIGWFECVGYTMDSPYLRPMTFNSKSDAEKFLNETAIYSVGTHPRCVVEVCE